MKNDLRKAFELMKFGICVNKGINIGVLVLFVVIGLVGETFYLATGFTMNYGFDLFAFFLIAVLSFPAQFMVTTDVSHIVQTSSYKKKIQTKMFAEVSLITSLAAMTFLVFIRTIASAVHPDLAAKLAVIVREDFTAKGRKQKQRQQSVPANMQDNLVEDVSLFEKLRVLRAQLANETGVPPYVIFGDSTLHMLASIQPETRIAFGNVSGLAYLDTSTQALSLIKS